MGRASGFGWRGTCSGVGGTTPPRLAPGGNGKGGIKFLAAAGHSVSQVTSHFSNVCFTFRRGFGDSVSVDPFEDQLPEIAGFHPLVPRFYPHS